MRGASHRSRSIALARPAFGRGNTLVHGAAFGHDFSNVRVNAEAWTEKQVREIRSGDHEVKHDMEGPIEDETLMLDNDGGSASPAAGPRPGPAPPVAGPRPAPASPAPTVAVPSNIRGAFSPAAMPNRIPPRVDTAAAVTISGLAAAMPDITLSIEASGGVDGSATINGAATVNLRTSATVQLRGVDQTGVGNAGRLRLVANCGARRIAASNGFSVSSVPQNWSIALNALITGTSRGMKVNNSWESDSGVLADLDEAERSEQVQYGAGTGIFAGQTGQN